MHLVQIIASVVFVLSWLGAVIAWSSGAYSLVRVFTDGSLAAIETHRSRAFRALALSLTFVLTGFLAGVAAGLFSHLHI